VKAAQVGGERDHLGAGRLGRGQRGRGDRRRNRSRGQQRSEHRELDFTRVKCLGTVLAGGWDDLDRPGEPGRRHRRHHHPLRDRLRPQLRGDRLRLGLGAVEEAREHLHLVLRGEHLGELDDDCEAELPLAERLQHGRMALDQTSGDGAVVGGAVRELQVPVQIDEQARVPERSPRLALVEVREGDEEVAEGAALVPEEEGEAVGEVVCGGHARIVNPTIRASWNAPGRRRRRERPAALACPLDSGARRSAGARRTQRPISAGREARQRETGEEASSTNSTVGELPVGPSGSLRGRGKRGSSHGVTGPPRPRRPAPAGAGLPPAPVLVNAMRGSRADLAGPPPQRGHASAITSPSLPRARGPASSAAQRASDRPHAGSRCHARGQM
jgi:hypothetical protein